MSIFNRFFTSRRHQTALALALLTFAFTSGAQGPSTQDSRALLSSDGTRAPLLLFIDGPGRVFPFHNGQSLKVGLEHRMRAIPERGAVFAGWNQVNVFVFTIAQTNGITTSTNLSPLPISITSPLLQFTVQPPTVLEDVPGFIMISQTTGWQANFVHR